MKKNGILWISWMKGKKDFKQQDVRSYLLTHTDLADVKVCSINETWSGLKFVRRKEKR
jgi:hypothetical protein